MKQVFCLKRGIKKNSKHAYQRYVCCQHFLTWEQAVHSDAADYSDQLQTCAALWDVLRTG